MGLLKTFNDYVKEKGCAAVLKEHNDYLKSVLKSADREIADLKKQIATLERKNANLEETNRKQEIQIHSLQKKFKGGQITIKKLPESTYEDE